MLIKYSDSLFFPVHSLLTQILSSISLTPTSSDQGTAIVVMQELKMMLRLSREAFFCVTFKKQEKTFPHTDASFGVINNPNTLEIILKAAILRPEIRRLYRCGWRPTSELGDEGDHAVLLKDLLQFQLHVLIHVGFECALQQDPPSRQNVMQPVRHAKHHPACEFKHQDGYRQSGLNQFKKHRSKHLRGFR